MIGGGGIGSFPVAGLVVRGITLPSITDLIASRAERFLQPWPWVEFYTITTVSNGILRFVDFQDPDARGSLPNLVPFDGEEFAARKIQRTAIRSAADSITTFDVTFEDVASDFARIMRAEDGLSQAPLRIDIIPWDLKDQPAIALTERYRIRQASATVGGGSGSSVTVEVGLPSLVDIDIPRFVFDRTRCFNDHNRRFELDNRCRTPSDEFEEGTFQVFGTQVSSGVTTWPAPSTKRKFGWWSLNAHQMSAAASTLGDWRASSVVLPAHDPEKLWTTIQVRRTLLEWFGATQNGPYMFRKMTGSWDVHTELRFDSNIKTRRLFGIVVQDDASTSDWLAWANAETVGLTEALRLRNVTAAVTVDSDSADFSDGKHRFRLQFDSLTDTFTAYVRPDDSSAWVQKFQVVKAMGSTLRLGLVAGSDGGLLELLSVQYRYFRFTEGGPDDCNRSLEACREPERDNEHQINVFPNIPHRATNS